MKAAVLDLDQAIFGQTDEKAFLSDICSLEMDYAIEKVVNEKIGDRKLKKAKTVQDKIKALNKMELGTNYIKILEDNKFKTVRTVLWLILTILVVVMRGSNLFLIFGTAVMFYFVSFGFTFAGWVAFEKLRKIKQEEITYDSFAGSPVVMDLLANPDFKMDFLETKYRKFINKGITKTNDVKQQVISKLKKHKQQLGKLDRYKEHLKEEDYFVATEELKGVIGDLKGSVKKLDNSVSVLMEIEADIANQRNEIQELSNKVEEAKAAREFLDELKEDIHESIEMVQDVDMWEKMYVPQIAKIVNVNFPQLMEETQYQLDKQIAFNQAKGVV